MLLGAWIWNISPAIFSLFGREFRWYGLLFACAFLVGTYLLRHMFYREGRSTARADKLLFAAVIGTVVGARLGHVFFYEPAYYLEYPWKVLFIWEGGLASHGGTIGIAIAVFLFQRPEKESLLLFYDRLVILALLGGGLIRLGNFANSELYGQQTNSARFGVVFAHLPEKYLRYYLDTPDLTLEAAPHNYSAAQGQVPQEVVPMLMRFRYTRVIDSLYLSNMLRDRLSSIFTKSHMLTHVRLKEPLSSQITVGSNYTQVTVPIWGVPRHPTQLYESLYYLLLGGALYLWWRKNFFRTLPEGVAFATAFMCLWGFRFSIEFWKVTQVDFLQTSSLNMGQLLSAPIFLIALVLLLYLLFKHRKVKELGE